MAVPSPSRPPLWARNNAKRAIDLINSSDVYAGLLKWKPRHGQVVKKAASENGVTRSIKNMEAKGRVVITGRNQFIVPCLGTVFLTEDNEIERNVIFLQLEYKLQRTGIATNITSLMNVPNHAFSRVFERDLRPPEEVKQAIMCREFIDNMIALHAQGDPLAQANSFAIRFLNGFLTGTIREMHFGLTAEPTKLLDVRTFLHRNHKPDWVRDTIQTPYTLFEHADRRSKKLEVETLSDIIEDLKNSVKLGSHDPNYKELPSGA